MEPFFFIKCFNYSLCYVIKTFFSMSKEYFYNCRRRYERERIGELGAPEVWGQSPPKQLDRYVSGLITPVKALQPEPTKQYLMQFYLF